MTIDEILSSETARSLPADYTGRAGDVSVAAGKALRAALDATEALGRIDPRFAEGERDQLRNGIIRKATTALDAHLAEIRGAVAAMRSDREGYLTRESFLRASRFDPKDPARHATIASDRRAQFASLSNAALVPHAHDAARNGDRALAAVLLEEVDHRGDKMKVEERFAVRNVLDQIVIPEADVANCLLLEVEQLSEDVVEAGRLLRGGRPNGSYAIRRGLRQHAATNTGAKLEEWFAKRREQREHSQGAAS
jgi:hypothetical protein